MIDSPSLYVGTYGKYNNGSIAGDWLNLEDYSGPEEFYEACQKLHGPGEHEFMFQDYSNFPKSMYSESSIPEELWAWLELSDDDKELLEVYLEHVNQDGTIEEAKEAYRGKYDSPKDWAMEYMDETMEIPSHLRGYIDYEQYAHDMGIDAVIFIDLGSKDTWVFNR
jgi:antirestriction protein